MKKIKTILLSLLNFSLLIIIVNPLVYPQTSLGSKVSDLISEVDSPETILKSNEDQAGSSKQQIQKSQDLLKEKKTQTESAKKEAEKAAEEKKKIEVSVQLKEKEADVLKQELKLITEEAKIKNDPALQAKAKELSGQSRQLEEEARIQQEKLKIADAKSQFVQLKVQEQEAELQALRKDIYEMRISDNKQRGLLERSSRAGIIVIFSLVLFLIFRLGLRWLAKILSKENSLREDSVTLRVKTLIKLFNWLGGLLIVIIAVYMVLENYGFQVAPLLAGAGIAGLAFGFGGQYLIRDIINGLFILIEDQYRINDVVKIGDLAGLVEDINLRITTLRDLEGRVIIIPNGEIKAVINFTKGYAQALFDVGVAYKENVDRVISVIKDI
ncbi:MAG: mechanosensitive ion channel [Candidatus Omnitrophica bacterium]|nr:mechanosensitive ion channel [Candidatus Omnitrophota bacterium]